MKNIRLSFILLSGIFVSGCGQKGDLYLPNIPPAPNVFGELITGPKMPEQSVEAPEQEVTEGDQGGLMHEKEDGQSVEQDKTTEN